MKKRLACPLVLLALLVVLLTPASANSALPVWAVRAVPP